MSAFPHPLRDRVVQTSRLTDVLKKECLGKLDGIIEQVWTDRPYGWHWHRHEWYSEDGSNATPEQLVVGEPENEAESTSRASSKEQPVSSKEQPVAVSVAVSAVAKEVTLQPQQKVQKRGRSWTNPSETFSSSAASWRCSDRGATLHAHQMSPVPMMRATWASRKSVDWDIGWLEPARPPSRSRSASPDGERDQHMHMTLPPMLLSHCEAKRIADASREAAAAASASELPEAARSTSEWRLRSLWENSVKYQVRI
mmetsp:Transcript_152811/g.266348  ORF Transcript_152811/g.266348 Transcript_152811/m.266348 type:complete len:255 (-) Transcript_152811:47-811(-)